MEIFFFKILLIKISNLRSVSSEKNIPLYESDIQYFR